MSRRKQKAKLRVQPTERNKENSQSSRTGSRIFRAKANDHVLGGDFENDDGTGGHSAYEEKYFLAEQCPLKDQKGAIRMKGLERTIDGRCRVGSQFMIWVGDLEYKVIININDQ